MLPEYKKEAALRLKVAAGHLEGVRRMVDNDEYCVDLMKQLAAVQGTLEGVQRILLRNHLSSCVADAIAKGMGEQIIDELMGALKYDKSLIDGRGSLALDEILGPDVPRQDTSGEDHAHAPDAEGARLPRGGPGTIAAREG
jgi:DNA-binding FrmR family transcriptional regulator